METGQIAYIGEYLRPKRKVYLDHNATTPVHPRVRRCMTRVLKKYPGNPSSIYRLGRKAAAVMSDARQQVADAIGAGSHEILFTACATESNNAVLMSLAEQSFQGKNKIVSSPVEHPSVFKTLESLQKKGMEVVFCKVDEEGRVDPGELATLLDDQTALVCCLLANNDIGSIQDLAAISEQAHQKGALVLSDCTQALGKIQVDVKALGVDYASFSAHKLYGPKGIGALYIREGSPFSSFMHGGSQEEGLRAGTESLHNIAGFGAACARMDRLLLKREHMARMKDLFKKGLEKHFPDCSFNSPEENCLPNTLHVRFTGMPNSSLLAMLDARGISVSAGSACSAGKKTVSRTLTAIGLSDETARESLRFSLGTSTDSGDIRYTLRTLRLCMEGKVLQVGLYPPSRLDKETLTGEEIFLLDVRPGKPGKQPLSLPKALHIPFASLDRHLERIPHDRHVLVFCQRGNLSQLAAYYLRRKGYPMVSSLEGGISAWHNKSMRNSS